MASTDYMEGGIEDFPHDEDDYLDDRSHKKLLSAVSSLYRKQRQGTYKLFLTCQDCHILYQRTLEMETFNF